MVLPEATDQWVADNSEFETLAELRDDFRRRMLTVRLNSARARKSNGIADALVALVPEELVPEAMIDAELENRAQDMALRLQAQGTDFQRFLDLTGQTQEGLVDALRGEAVVAAKLDLALRAIADAERLEVTDAEIDAEIATIAEKLERPADELRADFVDDGRVPALRSSLLKGKAVSWVSERANLVDEDGQPVSPDALELPTQDESGEDDQ
jgi:trigger factor